MKKYLYVIILMYIVSLIAIYFGVNKYIDDKDNKLREQALSALNTFFEQKPMYVDLLYGPYEFRYKKVPIPQPEEPEITFVLQVAKDEGISYDNAYNRIKSNLQKVWEEKYGNIRDIFDLDIYPTESENSSRTGWALKIVRKKPDWAQHTFIDGGGVMTYLVYPSRVSYKNISPLLYSSTPSVENAVQQALDFTINNVKSDLQPYYQRGCTYNLEERMKREIDNEYYFLAEDVDVGKLSFGSYSSSDEPYESGGMHNGYYEVTYKNTQPTSYSIRRISDDEIQIEKYFTMALFSVLATVVAVVCIVAIKKKRNK